MKKALLFLAVAATALIAVIYVRDSMTIGKAKTVAARVDRFCLDRRRLPDKDEFTALFPDLMASGDWFYWPSRNRAEVQIQYPMAARRSGAPGTPKTSEFTATTYAYVMRIRCPRPRWPQQVARMERSNMRVDCREGGPGFRFAHPGYARSARPLADAV